MTHSDKAILDLFAEHRDLLLPPSVIADNIGYGRTTVSKRIQHLVETGLVAREDVEGKQKHYYVSSEKGIQLVRGTLPESEIEVLNQYTP